METKNVFLLHAKRPEQFGAFTNLLIETGWLVAPLNDFKLLEEYSNKRDRELYCLGLLEPASYSFSSDELKLIDAFGRAGHSMIVAGGEHEDREPTNVNAIIKRFGVVFNEDSIIRPNLYKHYHPKEAHLRDFIVNRGFSDTLKKFWKASSTSNEIISKDIAGDIFSGPCLLYPHGCSLKVSKTSTILLTSSPWAIPCRQAICALYVGRDAGRVMVIGSSHLMNDKYIEKEDNKAIVKTLLEYIVNKNSLINVSDAKTVEIPDVVQGPDVESLMNIPISCFQESERLPEDKLSLIDRKMFGFDCSKLPMIIRAYQDLNLPHEPLTLIKPKLHFEPPKLEPATHGFLIITAIKDR